MDDPREASQLNSSQRLHLLTSCQYADKLLSEIEATLVASQSKSPFPKFLPDLSPAEAKVVQDYIARMRAQLVRILAGEGVSIPPPQIGSRRSIRITLGFVEIAFDECRPKRMTGYGDLSPDAATGIAGLVDEIQGIVSRLDSYLAQDRSAGLSERLERLERAGSEVALVQTLERAISQHGLVEFHPALATIIDRLETDTFEIAVFGRVSSGKSSLLNHIVGQDLLPVGVTPVTAVPTRLAYGAEPRAMAWFADRKPEPFAIGRLAQFVSEQHNPANAQHVTRILVELPAEQLRQGVVYVDTPGLGSLATAGAAETRAYLPRCDLGVVLIDAGSTLTEDDLATVQALYDAGIPASVLLSKADLLAPADRDRALNYVAGHLRSDLGLDLPVHAVSIKPEYSYLLQNWLDTGILPLYDRHAELARQSVSRKIGALRLGVEAALQARLKRSGTRLDAGRLESLDRNLRTAAGRIAQARTESLDLADAFRDAADLFIHEAAQNHAGARQGSIRDLVEQAAAEPAGQIASFIREAAVAAGSVLAQTAQVLQIDQGPEAGELQGVLKNMPRFDLGSLAVEVRPSKVAELLGRRWAVASLERRIRSQAGDEIAGAVVAHARVLHAWVRKTFAELQEQFDSFAGAYRAHVDRLSAKPTAGGDEQALRNDLAALGALPEDATERAAESAAERAAPGTAA
ncbi:MAG TPA: dynamin family protein [Bryobacteraceae bacterium]|nr:dynamin family protein [Bryobacteraceae bacterium]